jgi:CRISPR/Cas system-associated exonuclease Cas4 (RecB family)
MQHTERAHARLSASRAERFMTCPGSVRLEAQMPPEPAGEAAALGTMLHELSEKILRGEEIDNPDLDPDHLQMAQSYADYVNGISANPRKKLIEVNVDAGLKSLHQALGGTADAVIVDGDHLHVIDAKFGRVLVEAKDNKQLLTYALGVMRQFNAPASIQCTMHIFQPRAGHSKWTVSGMDLITHGLELKKAADLALSPDAPTNPSPDACKYCKAKTICPSMRQKVQDNARKEFATDTAITPEMLELAHLAADWSDAVITAAKKQLTEGVTISGWNLKPGRKTRFWKSEALAAAALKDHPEAFSLKSPSAIADLKIEVSEDLIGVKQAAASLAKEKAQKAQD